jgi:hypothetical protein
MSGSPIWSSAAVDGPSGPAFVPYTFDTGGVNLTVGDQYVLFISTSNQQQTNALDDLGFVYNPAAYSGGAFVFTNNGSNFGALSTNAWDQTGLQRYDAAITANFGPTVQETPEAGGLTVLMLSALVLGGLIVSRKIQKAGSPALRVAD